MADINEIITMGIGTPSSIAFYVRLGLGGGAAAGAGYGRPIRLGRASIERFGRALEQLPRSTGMEKF